MKTLIWTELENKYNRHNVWISLLRVFLCFIVIHNHFGTPGVTGLERFVTFFDALAVPSFFFLSFFLLSSKVEGQIRPETIKNRLIRLWKPIIFWNCFNFCFWNTIYCLRAKFTKLISFDSLLKGLLFTHVEELSTTPLWFLFAQAVNFIMLNLLFLFLEDRRKRIIALLLLIVFAFTIEYTGVLFSLFNTSSYEIKYTIGRTFECIPFMSCGIIYGWARNKLSSKHLCFALLLLLIGSVLAYQYSYKPEGFGYGGVYNLLAAVTICVFTLQLPDIIRGKVRIIINWTGSCTLGIYCMHLLVGKSLGAFQGYIPFGKDTLYFDALIFIVSLMITVVSRFLIKKFNLSFLSGIV